MKIIIHFLLCYQLFQVVIGQQDICQSKAFNCIHDLAKTVSNCPDNCQWCPSEKDWRKCQTRNRACLFSDRNDLTTTYNDRTACEAAGHAWCGGRNQQQCVENDPQRSQCFKKKDLTQCMYNNEVDCNSNGCFWCNEGINNNIGKCWITLIENKCPFDDICCKEASCMVGTFTQTDCEAKGCRYCTDTNGDSRCNFNTPGTTCPVNNDFENCFDGFTGIQNQANCESLLCEWCTYDGQNKCIKPFPDSCETGVACEVTGLTNYAACKSHGCEWCGSDSDIMCQQSTTCTTCECGNPVSCTGADEEDCFQHGCLWCDSNSEGQKCINVDAGGLTPGNTNGFTDCSRECGGGTQFRYEDCKATNKYRCPREYQTCNDMNCDIDICLDGERPRYDDFETCCQSHSHVCGRNILNEDRDETSNNGRKKRVVGGMDVDSNEKWPWVAVIYLDLDTTPQRCTGTLIGERWVVTTADCVEGHIDGEIKVHLDVVDRNQAPGLERGVANFHFHAIITSLSILELDAAVTPYSNYVFPLCMPNTEEVQKDRKCIVAGWGQTISDDASSCSAILQEATVRVMDWGLCEMAWGGEVADLDPSKYFCAGIPEGEPDACVGDEGAPLMCQRCDNCGWYLAGIATNHLGCGESQKPTLYYRTAGAMELAITSVFSRLDPVDYGSCGPSP